jgi:RNA-directed DNA polymerase
LVNTDVSWPSLEEAEARVLRIQTKLHQWATQDPSCKFDDLFNLVVDPAFLVVSWERVRANKGGRTAGVDGVAPRSVASPGKLITELRAQLKARTFNPMPVREVLIPKAGGKTACSGSPQPVTGWSKLP